MASQEIHQVKKINFSNWEKFIVPLLKVDGSERDSPILFYNIKDEVVTLSTSYQEFIIITKISYNEIRELYKDFNLNTDADVTLDNTITFPELKKFLSEFVDRGIEEE